MIKFITQEKPVEDLVFEMVEPNQFFVDMHGELCQKSSTTSYVVVASKDGVPKSWVIHGIGARKEIRRILDPVTHIQF